MRFEKHYCDDCITTHWMEITPTKRLICRGRNYFPRDSATHYTRWRSGGIELIEKLPPRAQLERILAQPEEIELLEQDW